MKRGPEVNVDDLNFPGQRDVTHVKAQNELCYNPLGTKYSQLENTDVRRKSKLSFCSFIVEFEVFFVTFRPYMDFYYSLQFPC